jgi:ankyrin repeat protein
MFSYVLVNGLSLMLLLAGAPSATRLADAAMNGDRAVVRTLLKQKVDVNAAQGDGMTALHWAALQDDLEMLKLLIAAGANVTAASREGAITPIFLACSNGNAAIVEALLHAGAGPNTVNANKTTALMMAASSGSPDTVKILLDHGADVNAKEGVHGQTALMFAAALNRAAVIKLLMTRGADAGIITGARAVERVRIDLDGHVYYDRPSDKGAKADEEAAQAGKQAASAAEKSDLDLLSRAIGFQSAQFLVAKSPPRLVDTPLPIGAAFIGGMTALLYASRDGQRDAVRALLDAGADINQANADKFSPLMMAIINGHLDLAKYLLDYGADPNRVTISGLTALYATLDLQWAPHASFPQPSTEQEETGYLDLMKALLLKGGNVNALLGRKSWFRSYFSDPTWVNPAGATAFWRAAQSSDIKAMHLLIDNGANPKIATKAGATPLMVASGVGWGANWSVNAPFPPLEAVKYCVELGNDVNAVDNRGFAAIHGAAFLGNNEIVNYLASKGAKVQAITKAGNSPADMANGPNRFAQPHPETVAILEKLGSPNAHNCRSDQCVVVHDQPLSKAGQADKDTLNKFAGALGFSMAVYLAEEQ